MPIIIISEDVFSFLINLQWAMISIRFVFTRLVFSLWWRRRLSEKLTKHRALGQLTVIFLLVGRDFVWPASLVSANADWSHAWFNYNLVLCEHLLRQNPSFIITQSDYVWTRHAFELILACFYLVTKLSRVVEEVVGEKRTVDSSADQHV